MTPVILPFYASFCIFLLQQYGGVKGDNDTNMSPGLVQTVTKRELKRSIGPVRVDEDEVFIQLRFIGSGKINANVYSILLPNLVTSAPAIFACLKDYLKFFFSVYIVLGVVYNAPNY